MPDPKLKSDNLEVPFDPLKITFDADITGPALPTSRKAPWLTLRLGFVGSREGFDLLRFEALTLGLSPHTAPSVIAAGHIDALVIESASDNLMGAWGVSFLDWAGADEPAKSMMQQAASCALPRIALLRGNIDQVALFAPLAKEADYVLVTDPEVRDRLNHMGITAELIDHAIQPALYNGVIEGSDHPLKIRKILSLDLALAIDDQEVARLISNLIPMGVECGSVGAPIRKHQIQTLPPPIENACIGTVTHTELQRLLGSYDLLLQLALPHQNLDREIQHALQAAASRCAVVILGTIPLNDPRRKFAHIFDNMNALRLFISRFQMDELWAQIQMQTSWRHVHQHHTASTLAFTIARCVEKRTAPPKPPHATVISITSQAQRLASLLRTFRSQGWENKELIIVARTDDPEQWDTSLIDTNSSEQIVFVPKTFGFHTALNIATSRGRGEYALYMCDNTSYSQQYIGDLMLVAAAVQPDIMGKNACIVQDEDKKSLFWSKKAANKPEFCTSSELYKTGPLAEFSYVIQRSLLQKLTLSGGLQHNGNDCFLDFLEDEECLFCVRTDALNVISTSKTCSTQYQMVHIPADTLLQNASV